MTKVLLHIYDYLKRHQALMWILLIVLVVLCVVLSLRLHYEENIADFLPRDKSNERYLGVYNGLSDEGQITVIFSSKDSTDGMSEERISTAVETFETYWNRVAEEEHDTMDVMLTCHIDESRVFDAMSYIRDHIGIMLTQQDYDRADSLLSLPHYVDTCLSNVKRMLSMPLSGMMTEGIANDPLNLFSPALKRLQSLSVSDDYQVMGDILFDQEGRHAFAFLTSPYETSDTKGNSVLAKRIARVIDSTQTSDDHITVSAVGAPLIAVTNAQQIKKDSIYSILIAVVLISIIMTMAIGYKRNLLWMAFSILFGWLFALAAISLFQPSISIIVVGIGSVLLGISVNYPLHYLDHLADHPNRRATLKDMIEPLVTGNITTVSAFACLVFVKADAMKDLGLFGALMLVGTILFVMVFLPHIAKPGRKRKTAETSEDENDVMTSKKSQRWARRAFLPVLLITLVLGVLSKNTSFDSDLHNINYMTRQQQADLELLNSTLQQDSTTDLVYIVSQAPTLNAALLAREQQLHHARISTIDTIDEGPSAIIPSLSRQQQSLQRWQSFQERHPQLRQQLLAAATRAGFTATAFAPFMQHLTDTYHTVSPDSMSSLLDVTSHYILRSDTGVSVVSFLHVDKKNTTTVKRAVEQLDDATLFAFDASDVGNHLVTTLNNDFNYILYVCSFVVFFFLWLSFGNLELSLLSFLPLTVGWLWILGLMDVASVQFNIVNIILATFIFGQGDDYTIFITEGLLYENAYGRKRLKGYRHSVILSALLMFVGMGALIIAKHPAMRSLGIVAMIGMATVVLMACYLPPVIFRWMVEKKGSKRKAPVTIKRLLITSGMLLFYIFFTLFIFTPFTLLYHLIGRDTEQKRDRYHRIMCRCVSIAVRHIPGVHYEEHRHSETFTRPAVIIANHQSHLDLMCMLALHPKVVIATNNWVWHNPIYSAIIRYAEFYPVGNGYQVHEDKLRQLVKRGYSIMMFPEGTRSTTCEVLRFHKGAFQLAKDLGVDILPLYLYGAGHVMPKEDILLRKGTITMEVGMRMTAEEVATKEVNELTHYYHHHYIAYCEAMRCRLSSLEEWIPMVKCQYLYKGRDIYRRCRQILNKTDIENNHFWPPEYHPCCKDDVIEVAEQGQGELSLLFSLLHPGIKVVAHITNEDDYLVATHCALHPDNLIFIMDETGETATIELEKGLAYE